MNEKEKSMEKKEGWFRILVLILTGIILSIWKILIIILGIVNWFIVIFKGKRSKDLAMFSEYWNTEVYKYNRYLTFVTNDRPFPFSNLERMSKFSK